MNSSRKFASGVSGWWVGQRNRLLSSSKFQHFAARFPLTRFVARRRASALFDLVAGFTYSQILMACVQTRLLEFLADQPKTLAEIALKIDLPVEGAERLLRGAAALQLVAPLGPEGVLARHGAALLGNPGIAAMIAHHHRLYADWADPVALLRRGGGGGELSALWPYAEASGARDDLAVDEYSALMGASQPLVAQAAFDSYSFDRHYSLLDVGGGEGAFLAEAARRLPKLKLGLFDLPQVAHRAQSKLDQLGLAGRTTIYSGSFLSDHLPGGYDLMTLIRVLHDHDDSEALQLLRNIHSALPAGGRLFIAEPMAQTPGAERAGDAYFGFYLLAMGSGRPRTPIEIKAMLTAVGFRQTKLVSTPIPLTTRAIIAKK